MRSAFVIGGVAREHQTSRVALSIEADGDAYEVLTATGAETVLDVRGVWLTLALDVAAPGGLSDFYGGGGVPDHQLWLAILTAVRAGQAVAFRPDVSVPSVEISVVPDLRHAPTLYAVSKGRLVPGASLKLRSRQLLAPDHAVLTVLAVASPYASLAALAPVEVTDLPPIIPG